ncbi:hypothetical protein JTB14_006729 [Gonioctena quinquepunctata]|nr:hypothetical protein JTB14_006729 [Gonioctena quinquepunctata]
MEQPESKSKKLSGSQKRKLKRQQNLLAAADNPKQIKLDIIYKQLEKQKFPIQKNYGDNKDSNPGSSTNSTEISQSPGNSESTQDLNLAAVVVQAPQPEKHYEQVSRLSFDNLKDDKGISGPLNNEADVQGK